MEIRNQDIKTLVVMGVARHYLPTPRETLEYRSEVQTIFIPTDAQATIWISGHQNMGISDNVGD